MLGWERCLPLVGFDQPINPFHLLKVFTRDGSVIVDVAVEPDVAALRCPRPLRPAPTPWHSGAPCAGYVGCLVVRRGAAGVSGRRGAGGALEAESPVLTTHLTHPARTHPTQSNPGLEPPPHPARGGTSIRIRRQQSRGRHQHELLRAASGYVMIVHAVFKHTVVVL